VSHNKLVMIAVLAVTLIASSCGGGSDLLSIQVLPQDPTILNNNTVYTFPGGIVQYTIQGWYGNRTSQTISSSSGKWSSTNTAIAGVDGNGLATSAGLLGVTTIWGDVGGHKSSTVLAVCDPSTGLCPP
jgi:hypothetical protein